MADKTPRKYGYKNYRAALGPELSRAEAILPHMANAVKIAEGNKHNFGVLSVKTSNSKEADTVLRNSIINNYARWVLAGKPGKFVDFMQRRWAPIGADNDPDNLNVNWAPNVRKAILLQRGPEKYENWKNADLVMRGASNEELSQA
jgi:hypothetical protein